MKVSSQDAVSLPLHDAVILELKFPSLEDGFDVVAIRIKINPGESRNAIRELGIEGSEFWFVFEGCWQITTTLIGYCSGHEIVSSFDLIEPSDLKEKLHADGVPNVTGASHFRIEGSHGSVLDIVAGSVSIHET